VSASGLGRAHCVNLLRPLFSLVTASALRSRQLFSCFSISDLRNIPRTPLLPVLLPLALVIRFLP